MGRQFKSNFRLAFISLKKELGWGSNPVGKVRADLRFRKNCEQIS
jgi:hypothetical protein